MRKILHKAKRINHDEWYEGFYCELPCEDGSKVPSILFIDEEKNVMVQMPVDPETVCDWTGLTDKNGVKIFEGDIVEYKINRINSEDEKKTGIVEYSKTLSAYVLFPCGRVVPELVYKTCIFEVVGNRWDNPELLEVEK